MKRWKIVVLSVLALPCVGALGVYVYMQGLGDLRTEYARAEGASAAAQARGRELLQKSITKLGGEESWARLREQAVEVTFQHTWHHWLLRTFFMPLEFSGQRLSLLVRPERMDARLTYLDGAWKGTSRGARDGDTYRVDASGAVSWAEDETARFHLQGYRFFFFLPFLLSEAELVTYAGEQQLHGETYDLVYVTWGAWEPQEAVDQYLIWIERESGRIDFVQSTVREMFARSIVGLALSDYREVLGVTLPFRLTVLEDIGVVDQGMHVMELMKVEAATDERAAMLRVGK